MDATPSSDEDRSGGSTSRRDDPARPGDVLEEVSARLASLEAAESARTVLAQVQAATLAAFTRTSSVRDPLPETAPDSAEEALAVLAGIDHLRASLAAVESSWQVEAEQRIRRDDEARGIPASRQGQGAGHEIALARRISPAASSFSLAKARRLLQSMPGTVDQLWSGAVTDGQASTVAGALDGARPETCERIDDLIREHPETLHGMGHKRLRARIRRLVQQLEPETSRERAERAARARHVTMTPLDDGMARVTAVLRGVDAVGVMTSLNTRAESLRAAGVKGSVRALEADLLVEDVLLSAEDDSLRTPRRRGPRPRLDVGIVITDTALLGPEDEAECAQLEGYGIIPAHILRDTVAGTPPGQLDDAEDLHPDEEVTAFFRRLYRSPRTGELIAMESRARAFPAGLARMIRWRDTTCRTPWCNAQIRQSDHVIPHHRGGPTSFANGQGLCVRCNLLKELGLWVLAPATAPLSDSDESVGAASPPQNATAPREDLDEEPGSVPPTTSASPPAAWFWTSPHGAQGTSRTPPLIGPPPPEPPSPPPTAKDPPPSTPPG